MRIVVLANDDQKEELTAGGLNGECTIEWIGSAEEIPANADALIDLLFEENGYQISDLNRI